ncbi:MAG: FAD-dependent oxidoreductase [Burkholderiaceae bacterium]
MTPSSGPAEPPRRRWLRALGHVGGAIALPGLSACDRPASMPPRAPADHPGDAPPDSIAQWLRQRVRTFERPPLAGDFVGAAFDRGHRLRDGTAPRLPGAAAGFADADVADTDIADTTVSHANIAHANIADADVADADVADADVADADRGSPGFHSSRSRAETQRIRVAIVGTGVAGLAAARALRRAGLADADLRLFELEDSPGGNSRSGRIGDISFPWGAHYLPVPDDDAVDLVDLLVETGAARRDEGRAGGRVVYDERMLCHAPQERLLIGERWQTGLMPPATDAASRDDAARFARLIRQYRASGAFRLGLPPSSRDPAVRALDAQTFEAWLDASRLDSPSLRWYLDYCCRDDFGAGMHEVSAWAGVHYFASRHGFFDDEAAREREAGELSEVLTWPQGNAWLIERIARPLSSRIITGAVVTRVAADSLDVWRVDARRVERWQAERVILAAPLMVVRRLLDEPPAPLEALAPRLRYASWRVANVHLAGVPQELPGAPRSWDNVVHGDLSDGALGYVDAMHQSLRSRPGPTVLSCYAAFGGSDDARRRLLERGWALQAGEVLDHLQRAHPDIRDHVRRVDIMRWGHAMLIPTPGLRTDPALSALREPFGRVRCAHGDLAAYSVFEEAFAIGTDAGRRVARELSR